MKDLIEDLRLNHEYCPKEVILKAADAIEKLMAENENLKAYAKHERSLGAEPFAIEVQSLNQQLDDITAERDALHADAARWRVLAHMEASRTAPHILADYIARPERLDYVAELHSAAMKEQHK